MGKISKIWHPTLNDAKEMDEQSCQGNGASKREQMILDAAFGPRSSADPQPAESDSDHK